MTMRFRENFRNIREIGNPTKRVAFYLAALCLIGFCMLCSSCSKSEKPKLSDMTEQQCLEWVKEQGITIPDNFADGNAAKFVKNTIASAENTKTIVCPYSAIQTADICTRICMATLDYHGIKYDKDAKLEEWSNPKM